MMYHLGTRNMVWKGMSIKRDARSASGTRFGTGSGASGNTSRGIPTWMRRLLVNVVLRASRRTHLRHGRIRQERNMQ